MSETAAIDDAIERAIAAGATPGAAIVVGRGRERLFESYYGRLSSDDGSVTAASLYDLSSLTKPLATLASLLRLVAAGKVSFETPIGAVLHEFTADLGDRRRARVTMLQLAAHASGLPARGRYFERLGEAPRRSGGASVGTRLGHDATIALAMKEPLVADPGTVVEYSDVGYILLGAAISRIESKSFADVVRDSVVDPIGVADVGFVDAVTKRMSGRVVDLARVAPTDVCPWRGGLVRGVVEDENAYAMGGIAGHAGLFGTAIAVHRLAAEYVAAYDGEAAIFDAALVRKCWAGAGCVVPGSTWAIGWDTPTPGASSAGGRVSRRAFGHLGFTGTSLWIDLERGVHVVLLTNRVHPSKDNALIREMRPRVHDAVFEVWGVGKE